MFKCLLFASRGSYLEGGADETAALVGSNVVTGTVTGALGGNPKDSVQFLGNIGEILAKL